MVDRLTWCRVLIAEPGQAYRPLDALVRRPPRPPRRAPPAQRRQRRRQGLQRPRYDARGSSGRFVGNQGWRVVGHLVGSGGGSAHLTSQLGLNVSQDWSARKNSIFAIYDLTISFVRDFPHVSIQNNKRASQPRKLFRCVTFRCVTFTSSTDLFYMFVICFCSSQISALAIA